VHLQSTAAVTGPGTVSFTVDANPAGSPARSSSIGVATAIPFSISEAAGPGSAAAPTFTSAGVLNGASFLPGAVSPGEIVTVKGSGLNAALGISAALAGGAFPTLLAGTQVLFDGVPAPIIYASSTQVNAIAPYGIAGKATTQVQVSYNSALSSAVAVPVVAASPALFTLGGGTGPGAILDSNGSVNSSANPASPGDIVVLFATGAGQTSPPGVDGQIAVSVFPTPVLPVSVTIGGVNAVTVYAGAAPDLVAGVLQVNAYIPAGLQGNQPVVLTVGNTASPAGITVALKGTTPPSAGTLNATPNPLNVCSATATASVTLSWSTSNVSSVEVVTGSVTGAVVFTGGPAGSVTLTAKPNTTYLLVNTSAGGTPASANVLSTVTLQQGTCPSQPGGAPPANDLAQSVSNWQFQFLNNGAAAQGGEANDTSPSDILDGTSSMYVYSTTANAILLTQSAPGGWNLSAITNILISMQSDVPPGSWNSGSPSFTLTSANGSLTLSPATSSAANGSYTGWLPLTVPLAGSANWLAVTSGQFNIQNVTSIQIGLSVAGTNWAVLLNAMFLK
jgi:uncharacterized protein (TIGR03437 family)